MVTTILINVVLPLLLATVPAWLTYRWGRKRERVAIEKENALNTTLIVDLVNKQVKLVYERMYQLESEMAVLKSKLSLREEALEETRIIIKAAYDCNDCTSVKCPVLSKQKEIDELNRKLKMSRIEDIKELKGVQEKRD